MNPYNEHVVRQFADGDEFDSSMWTKDRDDNGNLVCKLRIKLYFRLIEMKHGPTTGYYQENDDRMGTPHFDRILYDEWKREYKQVIEDFWTGSFWMITPKDYEKLNYGPNRPNIKCSLQVEMVPSPGGAHHKLNVLYTPEYRINRINSGGCGNTGWLADVGRGSDPDTEGKLILIKNVAHILTMPHQDRMYANLNKYFLFQTPILASGGLTYKGFGDSERFGDLKTNDHRRDVANAHPWQIAMERHTGVPPHKWKVVPNQVLPQQTGQD